MRNTKMLQYFILGLTLFALILTFVRDTQDEKKRGEMDALNTTTNELTKKISFLQENIDNTVKKNKELTDKNIELTAKANDLIKELQLVTIESKKSIETINKRTEYEAAINKQVGELKMNLQSTSKIIHIVVGGNTSDFSEGSLMPPMSIGGEFPIQVKYEQGKILLTLKVFDVNGNLIAEIENNFWRPNKNFTGKFNYDDNGFEVVDNKDEVILNVDMLPNNTISINGIFYLQKAQRILIAGQGMRSFPMWSQKAETETKRVMGVDYNTALLQIKNDLKVKRLFEYNSNDWLHKRVNP